MSTYLNEGFFRLTQRKDFVDLLTGGGFVNLLRDFIDLLKGGDFVELLSGGALSICFQEALFDLLRGGSL